MVMNTYRFQKIALIILFMFPEAESGLLPPSKMELFATVVKGEPDLSLKTFIMFNYTF